MAEQIIKITVPKGKRAIYDSDAQTIRFIPIKNYTNIRNFKDVCEALNVNYEEVMAELNSNALLSMADKAKVMLRMVLQAVNRDHKFSMIEGTVYYPCINMVRDSDYASFKRNNSSYFRDNLWEEIGSFVYEGNTYYLVGGSAYFGAGAGLASFYSRLGVGVSDAHFGFMRCKSSEVAKHVSKYFGTIVWDAMYADDLGFTLTKD